MLQSVSGRPAGPAGNTDTVCRLQAASHTPTTGTAFSGKSFATFTLLMLWLCKIIRESWKVQPVPSRVAQPFLSLITGIITSPAAISSLLSSHDTPHTSQSFGFFCMIHLVMWLLKKSQGDNAMQRTLPNTFHLHSLPLTTFLSFVIVLTLWILSRWELFSLQILMISSQQT